MNSFYLWWKR